MKLDRLLGITVFMLNRKKVTASVLAEKFEVSKRTIQRDMETLAKAGIPIASTIGTCGGYEIMPCFTMDRQLGSDSDYTLILTALDGFASAFDDPQILRIREKIQALANSNSSANLIHNRGTNPLILDLSALKESSHLDAKMALVDQALQERRCLSFDYTNARDRFTHVNVEPVALLYKWYGWYLFAYHPLKQDYRLFKLVRIGTLKIESETFTTCHNEPQNLLNRHEQGDTRSYLRIRLLCKGEVQIRALEYLSGRVTEEYDNGDFVLEMQVPEYEHMWFGSLLAFGNKVEVLEPEELRQRLNTQAEEIIRVYSERRQAVVAIPTLR